MALIVLASAVFYYFDPNARLRARFPSPDYFRVGQWTVLGMTVFLSLELGKPFKSAGGALLTLGLLVSGLAVLVFGGDYYSAKVFVLVMITLVTLLLGSRTLKVVIFAALLIYVALGLVVVHNSMTGMYPAFAWIFAGVPELPASYAVILQQHALRFAGFFGQNREYIPLMDLANPGSMALNAIPYMAIFSGHLGLIVCSFLGTTFMVILLLNAFKLPAHWERAAALGAWTLFGVNLYLSALIVISPRALMIWDSPYGLPFIGNFETTFQLMLLGNFVFGHLGESPRSGATPDGAESGEGEEGEEGEEGAEGAEVPEGSAAPGGSGVSGETDAAEGPDLSESADETGVGEDAEGPAKAT
jgi:hypothetical protein